jgi:phosphoribosylanthranilate isomerase
LLPTRRTRVKICGIVDAREAEMAVEAGADALGMIFADSPRRISLERAREVAAAVPALVSLVAVFVDPDRASVEEALELGCLPQFCGDEPAEMCEQSTPGAYIKVFHLDPLGGKPSGIAELAAAYRRATLLFDTRIAGLRGGTGRSFDWEFVREIAQQRPVIVSGGLTPENVGACVRGVGPYAVDVRSGVEVDGSKDFGRMRAFVAAVREASAES